MKKYANPVFKCILDDRTYFLHGCKRKQDLASYEKNVFFNSLNIKNSPAEASAFTGRRSCNLLSMASWA